MSQIRNQKVYRFYSADGELLHCGRTKRELHKRESEHRRRFEEPDGYAELVEDGLTMEEASAWEKANHCSPYDKCDPDDSCCESERDYTGLIIGGIFAALLVGLIAAALDNDHTRQRRTLTT